MFTKTVRGLWPVIALLLVVGLVLGAPGSAEAKSKINKTFWKSLAIEGFDPVAYFIEGRPMEGDAKYEYKWMGATWRFASQKHLDLFKAAPEKYAPQYGGYCAWAVAQGDTAGIDPAAWKIVNGKLYLNYSFEIQKKWEADIPGNIKKADANWPGVVD